MTGLTLSGTRQLQQPTGSAARSPHALRVCGEHCDEIRRGWSQDPGSSWIFGVSGCNVARRNEKPAERRALRKPLVVAHLGLRVTGSREPCYQNTSQVCVMKARVSSKFPQNPVTNGRSLWRFGVSPGIGFKSCYPGGAVVGPNGETLHTAQSRSGVPQHRHTHGRHEKTGQKAPESHQEPSNREGVVSGGGALSERAEGRQEAGNGIQVR